MERDIAFKQGDYELELEGAHVTVHVPHDVYADEIAGSAAMLVKSSMDKDGGEKNVA